MAKRKSSHSLPAARKKQTPAARSESSEHTESSASSHYDTSDADSESGSPPASSIPSSTTTPTSWPQTPNTPISVGGVKGRKANSSTNTDSREQSTQSAPSSSTAPTQGQDGHNVPSTTTDVELDKATTSTACKQHSATITMAEPLLPMVPSQSSSLSLVPYNSPDAFPLFRNGDVVISSKIGLASTTFQLHSVILSHHSPWFANSLEDASFQCPYPPWYSYTIEEVDGDAKLVRQSVSGDRPIIHNIHREGTCEPQIKLEPCEDDRAVFAGIGRPPSAARGALSRRRSPQIDVLDSYFQVFGAFYNDRPQISATDIELALVQADSLIKVAGELGCLHLIRPFISNTFGQYRQKLFIAIKNDPPRWMQVAMALQDQSIYSECLIHLVGAHPNWDWPTKRNVLSQELRDLVAKKAETLDQLCMEADRDLLLITITMGRDDKPVSFDDRSQVQTWVLVQLFRDEVAKAIRSQQHSSRSSHKRGFFYRKIAKGGSAYMDYEKVHESCARIMRADWKDLGEDLKSLKVYASQIVNKLGANELMIDPDANDIGYLTCVSVQAADIPWTRG